MKSFFYSKLLDILRFFLGSLRRGERKCRAQPQRILLLKSWQDHLGDMIFITGTLAHYRSLYPDAWIELACPDLCLPLFEGCEVLNAITPLSAFHRRSQKRGIPRFINTGQFDDVIYLRRTPCADDFPLIRSFSPAKLIGCVGDTIALDAKEHDVWKKILHIHIPVPQKDEVAHELDVQLSILRHLGARLDDLEKLRPVFWGYQSRSPLVKQWLSCTKPNVPLILCSPCGTSPLRNWNPLFYEKLFSGLAPCTLILTGTQEHAGYVSQMNTYAIEGIRTLNLCGQTTIAELIELIKEADLIVAAENGVFHFAATMGKGAICIAGGGHWRRFVPWPIVTNSRVFTNKLECFGCNWSCIRSSVDCILDVSPDEVIPYAKKMLPRETLETDRGETFK